MQPLAEQVLVDIIQQELSLPIDRVFVRDQNLKLAPDDGVYVVVGTISEQPIGVANSTEVVEEEVIISGVPTTIQVQKEIQQVVTQQIIQIDILSRSTEAILRRWEIFTAIASVYSEQQQEENTFKIFKIPSAFTNTSGTEGGSNLNKFSISVQCHSWYRKEQTTRGYDFYDDFNTRVDDEQSIETDTGIIEFEIIGDSILGGNS